MNPIRAIKGTRDILPGAVEVWQRVEQASRSVFARHAYREIRTPILESTELFQKTTGADTDIVTKEMYTFQDRAERSITMRPEGTPGVVRAALEAGMLRSGDIERLYYIGPMFRYERPQKGRYRQFAQIGAEAFGSPHPALDAELIQMGMLLMADLGIGGARLAVNSVGHAECRAGYRTALADALRPYAASLCEDCVRRLDTNALRILDCKVPGCQPIKEKAPSILDHLCDACASHFVEVRAYLDTLGVPYAIEPRLVRGLDYYTRTIFEITGAGLGAQNALCGGGRYDTLVASMGGPDTPAVGWAIGQDRLVMEAEAASGEAMGLRVDLYLVHVGEKALKEALVAAASLRKKGLAVRFDPADRDMKKQMARASSIGARFALIIGDRELERGIYALKNLVDGRQQEVPGGGWDIIAREVGNG